VRKGRHGRHHDEDEHDRRGHDRDGEGPATIAELVPGLIAHLAELVLVVDADGVVRWVNAAVTRWLGWSPDALVGRRADSLADPDDVALGLDPVIDPTATGPLVRRLRHVGGHLVELELLGSEVHLSSGAPLLVLSGRPARTSAEDLVVEAGRPGRRAGDDDQAILLVGLVDADPVGARLDPTTAAEVLAAVSERLRAEVRRDDLVVRHGDHGFAVLCAGIRHHETERLARRLLVALHAPVATAPGPVLLRASVGGAHAPQDVAYHELLAGAGAALLRATHPSGPRVVIDSWGAVVQGTPGSPSAN
jgi:GGDEF domain-containing protein